MLQITFPPISVYNLNAETVNIHTTTLANTDHQAQSLISILSKDEQERANRFHFHTDKNKYIIGRGTLRTLLGSYLEISPQLLQFQYGQYGKPQLAYPAKTEICFNLSHSHNLAAYAFTLKREIGIDIEYVRSISDLLNTAAQHFSEQEMQILKSLAPDEQLIAFFNGWTRKEALLKAQGGGINDYLHEITVTLKPHEPAQLIEVLYDPQEAQKWKIEAFTPATDHSEYIGALAIEWNEQDLSAH